MRRLFREVTRLPTLAASLILDLPNGGGGSSAVGS